MHIYVYYLNIMYNFQSIFLNVEAMYHLLKFFLQINKIKNL